MVANARVIEYESGRKCIFEHSTGPAKGSVENSSVEYVEGKTRFTRTADVKFNGIFKLLGPFLSSGFKRDYMASVGNVKRLLESEAQS